MDTMLSLPVRGTFYGVTGSFPRANSRIGTHTTCHSIQFANTLVIFDTGSGMLEIGNELTKRYLTPGITIRDIDMFLNRYMASKKRIEDIGRALLGEGLLTQEDELNVFIVSSHVHGDHLFGIQAFKPVFNPKTCIHMIGGLHDGLNIHEVMEQFVFRGPVFPVPWKVIKEHLSKPTLQIVQPDEHFTIPCDIGGDIRVWVLPMNHPNQSYGYRFEWGGKVITVTLDHEHGHDEYDKNIVRLWDGADVVVTEVQYDDEMYKTRKGFGHITAKAAAEHAKAAKPKKIWTTHHDPDSDFATIQEIARTVARESGVLTDFALEGTVF